MQVEQTSASTVTELWALVEPQIKDAASLQDAAQALVNAIHESFPESISLSRAFVTAALCELPMPNRKFVQALAESTGDHLNLKQSTPVLSLIGTHGTQAAWCDPAQSKDHLGIPMISAAFVSAIPMISRLLKELGVPVDWVDSHDSEIIVNTIADTTGLFFVENAATAKDSRGRNIIAAQDFVAQYNIQSVFGVGGAYPTGQIVVIINFCKTVVPRLIAEQFLPLAATFIEKTYPHINRGHLFSK